MRKEINPDRKTLNDYRTDHTTGSVYGYKHAYCKFHSCCSNCNKKIQFWCKVITKIKDIQTKIILKICR